MEQRQYEVSKEQLDRDNDYLSYYPENSTEMVVDEIPYETDFDHLMVKTIYPSKSNVSLLAAKIQQQVSEGQVDAIEAAIKLNATMNMCKEALELIRKDVVSELDKNRGKSDKFGCKVEVAEVGSKYDYSSNPSWAAFAATEAEAATERKKIEDRLKKIPAGKTLVDDETGEALTGPSKTSTTSFKVSLAK